VAPEPRVREPSLAILARMAEGSTRRTFLRAVPFFAALAPPYFTSRHALEAGRPSATLVARVDVPDPTDLSPALDTIRLKRKVPCLAALALRGDRTVARGIAGIRSARSPVSATLDDRFHLGSDTKAMTATVVATLVEAGRLDWSTTVGEILAKSVPAMHAGWRPVRMDQLLTHRGGAPADLNANGLWSRLWQRQGTPSDQRMQLVRGVVTGPPEVTPGTTYVYSNAGYAIAGAMIEHVTGRAWEDLMRDRLFAPLGITTGGFGAPGTAGVLDQPRGHDSSGKPVEPGPNADNPPAIGPAGTVHMTIADWARFALLHSQGDVANPARLLRLLKAESFDRLHRPAPGPGERYACGWGVTERPWAKGSGPADVGRTLTHAGSNTMWYCVVWIAPEKDLAVLIACNQGGDAAAGACDDAAGQAVQAWTTARV
jgi:CubicO group peptidase (beta-lactamase class C family)